MLTALVSVAREEGCDEDFVLTVETGPIGGITTQGVAFGANVNTRAILDMTAQFDFYHGGGLDVCYSPSLKSTSTAT